MNCNAEHPPNENTAAFLSFGSGTRRALLLVMDRPELERRSGEFATAAVLLCKELRKQPAAWNHADQLSRSATSAAANYRAASRSRSRKEFASKMGQVAEEADEAVFWLEQIRDAGLASKEQWEPLLEEGKELRAIFAASYKTCKRNSQVNKSGQ